MIIPIGHESDSVRRLPWVTFAIMALCIIIFAFTDKADTSSNDELIDVWKEIVNYYSQHSYLEINLPEDMELNSGQKYIIKMLKESSSGKEKSDELTIIDEQVYLDDLFVEAFQLRNLHPFYKWGLIPAKKSPVTLITHMFLHGGLWHLLGNLFFLYLTGPFLEDRWGRPLYAAFYIVSGMVAALAFSFHYPEMNGPLIGASGAISGVMAAFLVRFWKTRIKFFYWIWFFMGTFTAPAWFMLGFELIREFFYGKLADSIIPGGGGVAYWAHFWGLLFGIAVALTMRLTQFEEKHIHPKIESETSFVDKDYKTFEEALGILDKGDKEMAYNKLIPIAQSSHIHPEIGETLWNLGMELGRAAEVAPIMLKNIESEIRRSQLDYALTHYWQLKAKFPETRLPDNRMKLVLLEYLIEIEDREGAEEFMKEVFSEINQNSPPGTILQVCGVAQKYDFRFNQSIAPKILQMALLHPSIPDARKEELKQKIYSAPQQDDVIRIKPEVKSQYQSPPPSQPHSTAHVPDPDLIATTASDQAVISATSVIPIALKDDRITLEIKGTGQKQLPLSAIKILTVVKITPLNQAPFILIDLLLDDPSQFPATIRIARISSTTFDPRKFVPSAKNLLEAFRIFNTTLMNHSQARPFPNMESILLAKVNAYNSIQEYEKIYRK